MNKKNKMINLAEILGVTYGKEFLVRTQEGINIHMLINQYGLWRCLPLGDSTLENHLIAKLLLGEYEICESPWKAKLNQVYYVPDPLIAKGYNKLKYCDSEEDNGWYQRGLMCRTPERAKEIADSMIRVLTGHLTN